MSSGVYNILHLVSEGIPYCLPVNFWLKMPILVVSDFLCVYLYFCVLGTLFEQCLSFSKGLFPSCCFLEILYYLIYILIPVFLDLMLFIC